VICSMCGVRPAKVKSEAYDIALCDECTRAVLEVQAAEERRLREGEIIAERIVGRRRG